MKVTYNWLKDFVDIKISPQTLAEKLTMAGLEVTSLERKEGDFVFELEVTSNRPDCLSVLGIAREVAAITNSKFRAYSVERIAPACRQAGIVFLNAKCYPLNAKTLKIEIEDKKDCPLYTAKIIKDIKVGPSPDWLKKRLELIGCRSVNNIVDITNYILFAWGEPLHAFDLDKLSPQIIFVRRAKQNEKITTIDGQQRMLNSDTLVIADKERPIALAGIMGGKDTEVNEGTKNILLEAAIFNPLIVRRTRRDLSIQSDSSYRFERGIDLAIVENASWQAVKLIQDFSGGRCVLAKSSGLAKARKKSINLAVPAVNKILGTNINATKLKKTLNSLGFETKIKAKDCFMVEIPSHRPDVKLEIDLIEEIARIASYESILQTQPAVEAQISADKTRGLLSLTKNILAGLGLNEVITYSLIAQDLLRIFGGPEAIEILNPLSKEQEILRPSLIPSLATCVAYNLNQKQDYINIFEVAKAFSQSKNLAKEEMMLGIALCGIKSLLLSGGLIKDTVGLLHLKGILEVLFGRLGVRDYYFTVKDPYTVDIYVKQEKVGEMVGLRSEILDRLDIKNKDVFALEVSLDRLWPYVDLNKKFTHPPVYPGILRDISLILKEEILVDDILEAIREKGKPLLREARIIDYYKGKQIPAGFKGLTISCLYRADERTLTEEEIAPIHSDISSMLTEKFSAQLR